MQFLTRARLLHSVLRRGVQACSCRSVSDAGGPSSATSTVVKEPQGKEVSVSVSSLRADTVAAAGLDISRKWVHFNTRTLYIQLNSLTLGSLGAWSVLCPRPFGVGGGQPGIHCLRVRQNVPKTWYTVYVINPAHERVAE